MVGVWSNKPKTVLHLGSNGMFVTCIGAQCVVYCNTTGTEFAHSVCSYIYSRCLTPCRLQYHHGGSRVNTQESWWQWIGKTSPVHRNTNLSRKSNNLFHTISKLIDTGDDNLGVSVSIFDLYFETYFVYMWSHESDWKPVFAPPIPTGTTGHALSPQVSSLAPDESGRRASYLPEKQGKTSLWMSFNFN